MNEGVIAIIVAPLFVFLIFVAPVWLIMHYRSKKYIAQGLSDDDYGALNELAEKAERMSERIETLEAILDAESPDWRKKV